MKRLGLALSGGGFRATLYHLGLVRFLRDAGALEAVEEIASVSGGSILAAHLVLNWDRYNGNDEQFAAAAAELVKFVQFDVRNHIVRRLPFQLPARALVRLAGRSNRNFTPNALLERYYQKFLYGDSCLFELPKQPSLHLLATSVSNGALSVFNRKGLFIQQRGGGGTTFDHVPGSKVSIPRVVGASSAFPGFFPPVEITAADLGVPEGQFPTAYFTDGGVYDNLGLRAFSWLSAEKPELDHILVSDAGKPFQILSDAALGVIGQSLRASDILWDRVSQLERENFRTREGFVFMPITHSVSHEEDPAAVHPVIQAELQSIRTDLDSFSADEINTLSQHGYEVARSICQRLEILNGRPLPESRPYTPVCVATDKEPESEHTANRSKEVTRLAGQLRKSSQRRVWSTLLAWRDWPSYVYLLLAFGLFVYLPFKTYQLYHRSQVQGKIIRAIKDGNPEIRQILSLATSEPTEDWTAEDIREVPVATETNYDGVAVLSHSRIYDLRHWHPEEASAASRGRVYLRDQITFKLTDPNRDTRVIFGVPILMKNVEFRQAGGGLRGEIRRVAEPVQVRGLEATLYEFEYDLSPFPLGERVTVDVELVGEVPPTVRAPFKTHTKTQLITAWLLFPEDRPYRTYSLVNYPEDRSAEATVVDPRYQIDHPYGYLIGWSVVNPDENRVYECRWTTE